MNTKSVPCNNCGASLNITRNVTFLSCNFCGSSLKVNRTSGTTFTEILEGVHENTYQIAQDTRIITIQNEIERLDREWEMSRRDLLVKTESGNLEEPSQDTVTGARLIGIVIAFVSFFITVFTGKIGFGLFGFMIFFAVIIYSGFHAKKSGKYSKQKNEYQQMRKKWVSDLEKLTINQEQSHSPSNLS